MQSCSESSRGQRRAAVFGVTLQLNTCICLKLRLLSDWLLLQQGGPPPVSLLFSSSSGLTCQQEHVNAELQPKRWTHLRDATIINTPATPTWPHPPAWLTTKSLNVLK